MPIGPEDVVEVYGRDDWREELEERAAMTDAEPRYFLAFTEQYGSSSRPDTIDAFSLEGPYDIDTAFEKLPAAGSGNVVQKFYDADQLPFEGEKVIERTYAEAEPVDADLRARAVIGRMARAAAETVVGDRLSARDGGQQAVRRAERVWEDIESRADQTVELDEGYAAVLDDVVVNMEYAEDGSRVEITALGTDEASVDGVVDESGITTVFDPDEYDASFITNRRRQRLAADPFEPRPDDIEALLDDIGAL